MKEADTRPRRSGWAPGLYHCECRGCKCRFLGDKRAIECADCAYSFDAIKRPLESHVTADEINREVAVRCGINPDRWGFEAGHENGSCWDEYPTREEAVKEHSGPKYDGPIKRVTRCLDYCSDLNAMAAAEKTLTPTEWNVYCRELERIVRKEARIETREVNPSFIIDVLQIGAEADQKGRAFLKATEGRKGAE